jgi:hypothetical protein
MHCDEYGLSANYCPEEFRWRDLILQDLEQQPDHWFWVLRSITGENPVDGQGLS